MLAERCDQVGARRAAMRRERFDLVFAERFRQIAGGNFLVRAVINPGLNRSALAALLKLLEQIVEPAAQQAVRRAAGKQAAQGALQQSTKPAA
jgi:hypothetical protein